MKEKELIEFEDLRKKKGKYFIKKLIEDIQNLEEEDIYKHIKDKEIISAITKIKTKVEINSFDLAYKIFKKNEIN